MGRFFFISLFVLPIQSVLALKLIDLTYNKVNLSQYGKVFTRITAC